MAQQVFGCKRRRLPGCCYFWAAATDCPSPLTAPTDAIPAGHSCGSADNSGVVSTWCVVCALVARLAWLARTSRNSASPSLCCPATAQENRRTFSCHLKGCWAVAGCGGNQRLSPCRSPAGRGRLRPMQPNTCCDIAHQVARLRRGIPASAQRQARPRSQPRPGTRAPQPPQNSPATAQRRMPKQAASPKRRSEASSTIAPKNAMNLTLGGWKVFRPSARTV
jgi:hypothetical protein